MTVQTSNISLTYNGKVIPSTTLLTAGFGAGSIFTVTEKLETRFFSLGATLLSTYKTLSGSMGALNGPSVLAVFAGEGSLQKLGVSSIDKGILGVYYLSGAYNQNDPTTWGPITEGSQLAYTAFLAPPTDCVKGPNGDRTFAGIPAAMQNQSSFSDIASGNGQAQFLAQTAAAVFFGDPLLGLQATVTYFGGDPAEAPAAAVLDSVWAAMSALVPGVNFDSPAPFVSNNFSPASAGPDRAQGFGMALHPVA